MQEGNEEPFNIRLHLAKDILTIQEQDVICVTGEPFYSSVSNTATSYNYRMLLHLHTVACAQHYTEGYSTVMPRTPWMSANEKFASVNLLLINQMWLLNSDSPAGSWCIVFRILHCKERVQFSAQNALKTHFNHSPLTSPQYVTTSLQQIDRLPQSIEKNEWNRKHLRQIQHQNLLRNTPTIRQCYIKSIE